MGGIICSCGHGVEEHFDGLPGCDGRIEGFQCECGKIPRVVYEEYIESLRAKIEEAITTLTTIKLFSPVEGERMIAEETLEKLEEK